MPSSPVGSTSAAPAGRRLHGRSIVLAPLFLSSMCVLASLEQPMSAEAEASPPDGAWGIAGVRAKLDQETTATAGALHLGGLRVTAPFLLVEREIDPHWEINAGYFLATQSVAHAADPNDHFLRVGVTLKHDVGRVLVENRLLYEAILSDQNREDANRLRNRTRVTYKRALQNPSEFRIFGHFEPISDDRADRPLRVDMALGAGATLPNRWELDVFALRQTYPARAIPGLNALVVQLIVPITAGE